MLTHELYGQMHKKQVIQAHIRGASGEALFQPLQPGVCPSLPQPKAWGAQRLSASEHLLSASGLQVPWKLRKQRENERM